MLHAVNYGPFDEALALIATDAWRCTLVWGGIRLEDFAHVFVQAEESEAVKLFFALGGRES